MHEAFLSLSRVLKRSNFLSLVYISQPALHALYLLYVGCRYSGAAADRPPSVGADGVSVSILK